MKRFLRALPLALAWLMLCAFIWGWIFTSFLTDTSADKKLVIYVDAVISDPTRLSARMEEIWNERGKERYPKIRMLQAREFTYSMMGQSPFQDGDALLLSASSLKEYKDLLPEDLIPLSGARPFADLISYGDNQQYFVCVNPQSAHQHDGAAQAALEWLFLPAQ